MEEKQQLNRINRNIRNINIQRFGSGLIPDSIESVASETLRGSGSRNQNQDHFAPPPPIRIHHIVDSGSNTQMRIRNITQETKKIASNESKKAPAS